MLRTEHHEQLKASTCAENVRCVRCCLQMGLVSQDCLLFHGSVEDNIRYGTEHATSAQVEEAAKAAYAHDFIMAMPHVSQTVCQRRRCARLISVFVFPTLPSLMAG